MLLRKQRPLHLYFPVLLELALKIHKRWNILHQSFLCEKKDNLREGREEKINDNFSKVKLNTKKHKTNLRIWKRRMTDKMETLKLT